jgi:predicted Holliday junction resolvase-like endonuclease
MQGVDFTGSIGSLLSFYKHERNIFGRCPHCGEAFRLSEVKLTYGKQPPRDLLTWMKAERYQLTRQIQILQSIIKEEESDSEAELDAMRESYEGKIDSLNERWTDKVNNEVEKRIRTRVKEIREDAIERSRVGQLGKTLEKIAPMFPGFGHHPSDVRPIFDPIDFVVFDGYFKDEVTDIVFVEFKSGQSRLSSVQGSIREAVRKRRVHFEERRMTKETINMLTQRRPPKLQQLVE